MARCQLQKLQLRNLFFLDASLARSNLIATKIDHTVWTQPVCSKHIQRRIRYEKQNMVQTRCRNSSGFDDPGLCGSERADCPYGDVDCRSAGSTVPGWRQRQRDVDRHAQPNAATRAVPMGLQQ